MTRNGVHHGPPPTVQVIDYRPGELAISSSRNDDVHTIALAGELDLANAERVEQRSNASRGRMRSRSSSTSPDWGSWTPTGVRILVGADTRSRANSHRLVLRRGPAAVQRVIELTGLTDLLPFQD